MIETAAFYLPEKQPRRNRAAGFVVRAVVEKPAKATPGERGCRVRTCGDVSGGVLRAGAPIRSPGPVVIVSLY
jgi:hypothetical protein